MNYYRKQKQLILEKYGGDLDKPDLPDPPDNIDTGLEMFKDWLYKFIIVLEYKFEKLVTHVLAKNIPYDNSISSLGANNVQDAIDELATGSSNISVIVDNTMSPYTIPSSKRIIKCDTTVGPIVLNLPDVNNVLNKQLKIYIINGNNNVTINANGANKIIHNTSLKSIVTITNIYGSVDLFALTNNNWYVDNSNGLI